MKEYFGAPTQKEMAPWISALIKLFRDVSQIELHIVAPNVYNNTNEEIIKDGIHYHFFQFSRFRLPKKLAVLTSILWGGGNFNTSNSTIRRIISDLKPDIIHLHGVEHPYYSAGIISLIDKYPILVSIQGFIGNVDSKNKIVIRRIENERYILQNASHFGVTTEDMIRYINQYNPSAKYYFIEYPVVDVPKTKDQTTNESIDIIFFARVCKSKGIEDLLKALQIVKRRIPDVSLVVIGDTPRNYYNKLKTLAHYLGIDKNVKFIGFLNSQNEVHLLALNAKVYVLPTYFDAIPSTMIESMLMKLPVISYSSGGIPELNREGQAVLLIPRGDIEQLASMIIQVLYNPIKRRELAEFAYNVALKRYDNNKIVQDVLCAYTHLLDQDHFARKV